MYRCYHRYGRATDIGGARGEEWRREIGGVAFALFFFTSSEGRWNDEELVS